VQQRMPIWNDHAFGPGIVAWRKEKIFASSLRFVGKA